MIINLFTLTVLAVAVGTGLFTMNRHQAYFSDFTAIDLINGRMDGWLFVLNSLTTAGCLVDLVLHTTWVVEQIPMTNSYRWMLLWEMVHTGMGAISIIIHMVIHNLLKRDGFCRLCRQPWKH